jgi:hypothetical protein
MTFKARLNVFLSRYSLSTHSIVVFFSVLVTMYYEVPEVHSYVYNGYTHLPTGLKNFISVMVVALAWYWRGRKIWPPMERAEKTPIVGSAPPGTSAGGDNAPVEVSVAPLAPVIVPGPAPTVVESPAVPAAPSTKPPSDNGW